MNEVVFLCLSHVSNCFTWFASEWTHFVHQGHTFILKLFPDFSRNFDHYADQGFLSKFTFFWWHFLTIFSHFLCFFDFSRQFFNFPWLFQKTVKMSIFPHWKRSRSDFSRFSRPGGWFIFQVASGGVTTFSPLSENGSLWKRGHLKQPQGWTLSKTYSYKGQCLSCELLSHLKHVPVLYIVLQCWSRTNVSRVGDSVRGTWDSILRRHERHQEESFETSSNKFSVVSKHLATKWQSACQRNGKFTLMWNIHSLPQEEGCQWISANISHIWFRHDQRPLVDPMCHPAISMVHVCV